MNRKKKEQTRNLLPELQQRPQHEATSSEEITDIVDRMPMTFGRWVAISMLTFSVLLLIFGWIIKYPDSVTGYIKINSDTAPVKLVANASGNIRLLGITPQQTVAANTYIAVIENPAKTSDIRSIAGLLETFNPNDSITESVQQSFPEKVSLGELNVAYYTFLSAMKAEFDYKRDNLFDKQRAALNSDIYWKEHLLDESEQLLALSKEKLTLAKKWLDKYASLNKSEVVTYEYELDNNRNTYLAAEQEKQNLQKETTSIRMQIVESRNQLTQLEVQQKEKERQLRLDLLSSYHALSDNIKAWEQKYVFKAPFAGRVEYLKFIAENQFVQAGETIFGLVPKETDVLGQVLLPAAGAGKVKVGSRVTIKLDNYPYMEYGSVEGEVASISLLTQEQQTAESTVDTYLIVVRLPNGLTTNYGQTLAFRYEIGGTADIIVKERRLIERLFDNLKYRTK